MKKTKIFVMTLAIAFCTVLPAYAKLPLNENGVLLVGDKAYSLYYLTSLSSTADLRAINDSILHYSGPIYYIHNDSFGNEVMSNINNISSSMPVANESQINGGSPITFIGINGTTTLNYDSNINDYETQVLNGSASINVQNFANMKLLQVTIPVNSIKGLNETPTYFKLEHSADIASLGSSITCLINGNTDNERVYILSADKRQIASGYINTFGLLGLSNQPLNLTPTTNLYAGNSVGNINNGGYAAYDGLWTYYSNTADGGKLYKVKTDGQDNQIISNDQVSSINVVGNVIYYSNISDGSKIYKVNNDGTGRAKVCDDMASYLTVSGSYIYYSNHSKGGSLSKVDIFQKGGNGSVITSDDAAYINVSGNRIYYSNNSDNKKIYAVNTDGLGRVCLSDSGLGNGAKYVTVGADGYIYYSNYNNGGKIYKIKIDGSEDKQVSSNMASAFNIVGNDIYYSNYNDGGKLYKVGTDGSGETTTPLIKDSVGDINIAGSNIYYTKSGKLSIASPVGSASMTVSQVSKPQLPDKVQKVNNVSGVISSFADIGSYAFPDRVPAIMSNNQIKEIVVNWDLSKYVKKGTAYTYTGTLLGYGNKVTITLTPATPVNPNNVTVTNTAGVNDTVTVTGLNPGDIVKVYKDSDVNNNTVMGTATVQPNSTTAVVNLLLDQSKSSIWVTLTTAAGIPNGGTLTESARVEVPYLGVTTQSFAATADNENGPLDSVTVTGANIGDTIKIYKGLNDITPITGGTVRVVQLDTLGRIAINNLDFGQPNTGSVYVSVTTPGKAESVRKQVTFNDSPNVADLSTAAAYLKITDIADPNYRYSLANALALVGDSYGNVINNIVLPTAIPTFGSNIVTVNWSSSSPVVTIDNNIASIHRPPVGSGPNPNVTLTANLRENDATMIVNDMNQLTIPTVTQAEAVALDKSQVSSRITYAAGDSQSNVTNNFTLPQRGLNSSTITWSSSDPAIQINGGSATVTQPANGAGDKNVNLTATITNGAASDTLNISFTIKQLSSTNFDLLAAEAYIHNFELNYGADINSLLNISLIKSSGISITWQSSNTSILTPELLYGQQDGKITVIPPSYSQGPKNVQLTATLTKNQQTVTMNPITVIVDNAVATPTEFANAVSDAMSTYMVTEGISSGMTQLYLPLTSFDTNGPTLKVSPFKQGDASYTYSSGDENATITWSSDNSSVNALITAAQSSNSSTIDISGISKPTTIMLNATIKCGGAQTVKIIPVTIN